MASESIEKRSTKGTVELRAAGNEGLGRIGGYALKYRTLSQNLGGFVEQIEPGAVDDDTIAGKRHDVLARYQHDDLLLLGRLTSGTLRLAGDAIGLDYDVDLPETDYAANLRALAARGDVAHSSFAFRTLDDDWDFTPQGFPVRTLRSIQLVDVAPVVTPAYMDTSSGLRSLAERRGLDLDVVARAASSNDLGTLLREGIPQVIDLGQGATQPTSIARRRADLALRRMAQSL